MQAAVPGCFVKRWWGAWASKVSTGDFCARLSRAALFDPCDHAKKRPQKALCLLGFYISAGGGGRTHTVSPPTDFESVSSANSNTPAYVSTLLVYQPHAKLSRHPRWDFADKFSDFFCQKALTNGFHAAIIISVA